MQKKQKMQQYDKMSTKFVTSLTTYGKYSDAETPIVVPPYSTDPKFTIVDTKTFFNTMPSRSETENAVLALEKELQSGEDRTDSSPAAGSMLDMGSKMNSSPCQNNCHVDNPMLLSMMSDRQRLSASCNMMPSIQDSPPDMCPNLWTVDKKTVDFNIDLQLNM